MGYFYWCLLIGSFLAGLGLMYYVWKNFCPSDNIFLRPIPPDPPQFEKLDEEELIKRTFNEKELKKKYDTIIIGSGNAGLAAASVLAQEGKSILLLEQTEQLGGMTSTFEEGGFEFPVGLHLMAAVNWDNEFNLMWKALYDKISEKKIVFKKFDGKSTFRIHCTSGEVCDICIGREKWEKYMFEKFPKDEKKIKEYLDLCYCTLKEMALVMVIKDLPKKFGIQKIGEWIMTNIFRYKWFKYEKIPSHEFLNEYFEGDKDMIEIFAMLAECVGSITVLPVIMLMFCQAAYLEGATRIRGGSSQIGKKTARAIEKFKGQMFCNARVTKILLTKNNTKACGVELENGLKISSDHVISTAGIYNTYSFLPKKLRPEILREYKPSAGHFFIFVGLDCSCADVGMTKGITSIPSSEMSKEFREEFFNEHCEFNETQKDEYSLAGFICCGGETKNNKTELVFLYQNSFSSFEKWKSTRLKQRGNEYDGLKEKMTQEILDVYYKHYPKLKDRVEYCNSGTVLSTKHWCGYQFGESYGMLNDVNRSRMIEELVKKNKIKNLHFSGVDTFMCDSIGTACMSGFVSAQKILKRNVLVELQYAAKLMLQAKKKVVKEKEE